MIEKELNDIFDENNLNDKQNPKIQSQFVKDYLIDIAKTKTNLIKDPNE